MAGKYSITRCEMIEQKQLTHLDTGQVVPLAVSSFRNGSTPGERECVARVR